MFPRIHFIGFIWSTMFLCQINEDNIKIFVNLIQMDASALLAPLGKGVRLHITYSYSSTFTRPFPHHCIHRKVYPFIHCFGLPMTLAVSSRSWNVLLIFSCVSFDVLYSIERACKMAFQKNCYDKFAMSIFFAMSMLPLSTLPPSSGFLF